MALQSSVTELLLWVWRRGGQVTGVSFEPSAIREAMKAGLIEHTNLGTEAEVVTLTPSGHRLASEYSRGD